MFISVNIGLLPVFKKQWLNVKDFFKYTSHCHFSNIKCRFQCPNRDALCPCDDTANTSFDFLKINLIYVASSRNSTSTNFHCIHQSLLLLCPELKHLANFIHLCRYMHKNNKIPNQPNIIFSRLPKLNQL